MLKLAAISGFFGLVRNRFIAYHKPNTIADKIRLAAQVDNLSGLELCYPEDFGDFDELKRLMEEHNLGVPAVNFRSRRDGRWWKGAFSSAIAAERREATEDLLKAAEYARRFGCNRVTSCPLNEGHDYPFEMDYGKAYDAFENVLREAADSARDVRFCLEYKWTEPRARCLIATAGEALSLCNRVGRDNVGVTLDFGHSIYAGERPAQSLTLLHRENRLFHVHLNDNDKNWDWDMMPGAYNFWETVEFFYYLKKIGYDDWYSYDIISKEHPHIEVFNAATFATLKLKEIADRVDPDVMEGILAERNPPKAVRYLFSLV